MKKLTIRISGEAKTGKTALASMLSRVLIPANVSYKNTEHTEEHLEELAKKLFVILGDRPVEIIEKTTPSSPIIRDDVDYIYNMTQKYGGSFAQAMGRALLKADLENQRKLLYEFKELYAKYLLM